MNITYDINTKKNGYKLYYDDKLVFVQNEPNIPYRIMKGNITDYKLSAESHIAYLNSSGYFLSLEDYKIQKSNQANLNLLEYKKNHPILSDCHKDIPKYYDISDNTQTLLAGRIITASVTQDKQETTYYTSWMAYGEPCEYDWTLEELQQLAAEMESFISPLMTRLNEIILSINACRTKREVDSIEINF